MKISHIFWTDRDISKIRKVLNSAYHEEQAVEVSRKSANFSFAGVKGLQAFFRIYSGAIYWLFYLARSVEQFSKSKQAKEKENLYLH